MSRIELMNQLLEELDSFSSAELMASREQALSYLSHQDSKSRRAALIVCELHWEWGSDETFIEKCQELAANDPCPLVRDAAINALGSVLEATKDKLTSEFLAGLVADENIPSTMRASAYWALRRIQLGSPEEDCIRHSIVLTKELLRRVREVSDDKKLLLPEIDETQLRKGFLCSGKYPDSLWDTADEFDWQFVEKYRSCE